MFPINFKLKQMDPTNKYGDLSMYNFVKAKLGGNETGFMYVQYIQGI